MSATYGTGLVIGCFSLSGCASSTKPNATTKKEKKMDDIIAYCGSPCHGCAIYLATREKNEEKRYKMRAEIAEQIKKLYGQECKPEDVTDCDGCKAETGRLFSGCKKCPIRNCASQKGVETCAHCDEYVCENLETFFNTEPDARKLLDEIRRRL